MIGRYPSRLAFFDRSHLGMTAKVLNNLACKTKAPDLAVRGFYQVRRVAKNSEA
jgi:hypothetical protein